MDRPYDSIPRQGEHRGRDLEEEPTTSVRAQEAAKPSADEPKTTDAVYQSSYSESEGRYRIRRWRKDAEIAPGEGYEEIGRVPDGESLSELYEALPESPRYVVFENLESSEVYFDRDSSLSGDWTGDGRFDQVTVFDDEEAAAAYAESNSTR